MDTTKTTDILKMAILMEMRGKAFYLAVAGQTKSEAVSKIFNIMAGEEQTHIEFLSRQFSNYQKKHEFTKDDFVGNRDGHIADLILGENVKKEITAASYEAAAISAAIDMETKAIEVYSQRAAETTDQNEKELFLWLANWEKGHHKILNDLNEELKQSIWFDNHFWPF
ncbi:MAG: ferritin-like domain-containing protein [Bacteroidales bacterium]